MSETKHTPEPWMYLHGDRLIYTRLEDGCKGIPVAASMNEFDREYAANAERIVECVNAMEGVSRPSEWRNIQIERIKEISSLKQQRNEAFSILETIISSMKKTGINCDNAELYNKINNLLNQ